MSWEAFRLTSKSPSELLHTLGPHGVDSLIRQALDALWREYPEESRTFENVRKRAGELFARNMRVWASIKKPSPQAFFENLLPYAADGHMRQAMVLAWMMMPRTGGRDLADVRKAITDIYQRNVEGWEEDNDFFTKGRKRKARKVVKTSKSTATKKKSSKTHAKPKSSAKKKSHPKPARPAKRRMRSSPPRQRPRRRGRASGRMTGRSLWDLRLRLRDS